MQLEYSFAFIGRGALLLLFNWVSYHLLFKSVSFASHFRMQANDSSPWGNAGLRTSDGVGHCTGMIMIATAESMIKMSVLVRGYYLLIIEDRLAFLVSNVI